MNADAPSSSSAVDHYLAGIGILSKVASSFLSSGFSSYDQYAGPVVEDHPRSSLNAAKKLWWLLSAIFGSVVLPSTLPLFWTV